MPGKRKTHLKVSPFRRILSVPVTVFAFLSGVGPFVDPGAYRRDVFDPMRDLAPLEVWGLVWLVAAVCGAIGARYGRWGAYTAANIIVVLLSAVWLGALVYAKWVVGLPMSVTALALWLFPFTHSVVVTAWPADVAKVPANVNNNTHP